MTSGKEIQRAQLHEKEFFDQAQAVGMRITGQETSDYQDTLESRELLTTLSHELARRFLLGVEFGFIQKEMTTELRAFSASLFKEGVYDLDAKLKIFLGIVKTNLEKLKSIDGVQTEDYFALIEIAKTLMSKALENSNSRLSSGIRKYLGDQPRIMAQLIRWEIVSTNT